MYLIALLLTLRLVEEEQATFPMEAQAIARALKRLLQQETVHRQKQVITAALLATDGYSARIRLSLSGSDPPSVIAGLHALTARSPLQLTRRRCEAASIDLAQPL